MRRTCLFVALIAASLIPTVGFSQTAPQETSRAVEGGGVKVSGWTGQVDAKEAEAGMTLNSAKFAKEGDAFHIVTGPAVTYWNPANKASGDYTVKAKFTEQKYMNLNDHPHPYGIMIAGNDLGTDKQSYLYCAAYGNGTFIVRGFSPAPFQVNGRRASTDPAVNKASAKGESVTQEIALSVKGDKVECAINNKVVGSYDKASVIGEGKLKTTDGVYGIRFGHNTEVTVSGLTSTKP
jgi:hypothetical protein